MSRRVTRRLTPQEFEEALNYSPLMSEPLRLMVHALLVNGVSLDEAATLGRSTTSAASTARHKFLARWDQKRPASGRYSTVQPLPLPSPPPTPAPIPRDPELDPVRAVLDVLERLNTAATGLRWRANELITAVHQRRQSDPVESVTEAGEAFRQELRVAATKIAMYSAELREFVWSTTAEPDEPLNQE